MKKLALLVIVSAIFAPLAASAFDFGTAVRSYNITRDSTTRDQSSDQRLVEQLAKRIDNGDEVFVTKETREKRFISRFEQALSDSGLSPSPAVQTTHIVKIEEGGTVFYEVWTFRLYSNREGVEKLFAERYFLFCDKKIIGMPGLISYKIIEGGKAIDIVLLNASIFNLNEYRGSAKGAYEATCNSANQSPAP